MSQVLPRLGLAFVVVCCVLSLGCPSSLYHADSKLNDDGSIERVVYQPAYATPDSASKRDRWSKTTFAPDPDGLKKQNFVGPYADLPAAEYGKDRPYFVGVGRFDSPKAMPDYYVRKAPPRSGLDDAKLVRNYERIDHVFVVEHRWSETLTDVVTLDGMQKARDELADLFISIFAETFEKANGKEWDAAGLLKWLKEEAKPCWAEMTDYTYLHCLNQKGPDAEKALHKGLSAICARHGLVLQDSKEDSANDANELAFRHFAMTLLRQGVKSKKDGQPIDATTALNWVEEFRNGPKADQPPPKWRKALDEVIATRFGVVDNLNEMLAVLLVRVFGFHSIDSIVNARIFDYTMTVPGEVIETNGEVLEKNKVRWKFPTKLAYPRGYTMTVRSLAVQTELQKELLKGELLNDLKARQQFVFQMTWAPLTLRNTLRECRVQKSMTPLEVYQKKATPEELEWLQGLMKTLTPSRP